MESNDTKNGTPFLLNIAVFCVLTPALIGALLLVLTPRSEVAGGRQEMEYAQAGLCAVGITQWLALSLLVPSWTRRHRIVRAGLLLAIFVVVGALVALAFPGGRIAPGRTLAIHVYLALYGVFVAGVAALAGAATRSGWVGQAVAVVVAAIFACNVLLANLVLEKHAAVRNAVIAVTLGTNPMAVAGACTKYDVMRKGLMYEASRISYYNYAYPPWYASAGAHLVAGLVMAGVARGLAGKREGENDS